MLDNINKKMTACHDPYRELELYLEQAQEEIGKAIKELEGLDEYRLSNENPEPILWKNSSDTLLPPPQAFCSPNVQEKSKIRTSSVGDSLLSTVKRVCHDGNLVDIKEPALIKPPDIPRSNRTCFSSTLGSLGRYRNTSYSPNTRRRLWQMHPSISFPETSKDLELLGKDLEPSCKTKCNGSVTAGCLNNSFDHNVKSLTLDTQFRKPRQRSNSGNSAHHVTSDDAEYNFNIPRPPSGDVNLLSIWANNLVLELDKSFSGEFFSNASFSPSSDYSLSPTKPDDPLDSNDGATSHFNTIHNSEQDAGFQSSLPGTSLKLISMSPDSGIEQLSCETPDMFLDCDSITINKCEVDEINGDALIPNHITPPPPEFGDEESVFIEAISNQNSPNKVLDKKLNEVVNICAAVPVAEIIESTEVLENSTQTALSSACVIAPKTVEFEKCTVLGTTCAINDASCNIDKVTHNALNSVGHCTNPLSAKRGYHTIPCVPKFEKITSIATDKWSSTLPRDSEKVPADVISFQRSVSQSAVSNVNPVSISELAAFIQQLKIYPEQPPSCDVSTDVKDDNENKDAVTQTTPVPLSRSSSFTWVTECDCSDWEVPNLKSGSDESLTEKCSNCDPEKKTRTSPLSSFGISSSDDDGSEPPSPGSHTSSLYLSACSGSSDSFEDTNLVVEVDDSTSADPIKTIENDLLLNGRRSLRSSEGTLRGSNLGDISEEQVTSETVSIKSNISNSSPPDSSSPGDSIDQSASFPSTLKGSRKSKSTGSPAQPIEPTILIVNELNLKSVSAPVLLRQKRHASGSTIPQSSTSESSFPTDAKNQNSREVSNQVPLRSQSAKELNELQAIEASSWLRAAGFPQYAQMYEDNLFPIDISVVQKDHAFLPQDAIQSLFRRVNTLNRCANTKFVDYPQKKSVRMEDSDDEEQYALSENWEFQRASRRWSRITASSEGIADFVAADLKEPPKPSGHYFTVPGRKYLSPEEAYCSSHDSVFIDEQHSSPDSSRRSIKKPDRLSISPTSHINDCSPGSSSESGGTLSLVSEDPHERRSLRRSGSDRVKEGAKALLRRMESLKGRRKKKNHEPNKSEILPPSYSGTDGSSSSSVASSPQLQRSQKISSSDRDKSLTLSHKKNANTHSKDKDTGAHSDSECRVVFGYDKWRDSSSKKKQGKNTASKTTVTITSPSEDVAGCSSSESRSSANRQLLHPDTPEYRRNDNRGSYYDNISAPIVVFNDLCARSLDSPTYGAKGENVSNGRENQDDGEIIIINNERRDSGVGSSLTRGISSIQAPWHCFPFHSSTETKSTSSPSHITDLTAPQMLLLRKLSLLKLTTVMERFSPSSRTGWSWAMPKFIRRIRNPDYKDKVVFGVPLLLILQRTGQPLPISIQAAIHYLRKTALDSTGIFRKSGVRSRIQKLKTLNESNPNNMNYEEQQSYDVADMVKQYFRELPEALLTNKLSETFISIFQFIPEEMRLESIQAALMLMPDENREVLQSLLEFLHEVCQNSGANQMTATNIAVCFAPSLFHLSSPRSASSSPRRRKTVGAPDLRELNENRAAYECLSCMVTNYKTLFSVSEEMVSQSRIASAIHSQPATIDEISSFTYNGQNGLKGYFDSCIQLYLKEAKEKYKGFVNVCQFDHVDLAYKKLADGHPLRLWKVSTEVEAPPFELLNRILRERHLWDTNFTKSRILSRVNNNTEIFQYLSSSLPPHPPCDFCVLRSWRTDLPKGACVLIETSVNHPDAEVNLNSVRALALASRYLIEPCGSGKSRITYLSRVDTRGRSPEWYNRAYGHLCTLMLVKLRNSFARARTSGPETKV